MLECAWCVPWFLCGTVAWAWAVTPCVHPPPVWVAPAPEAGTRTKDAVMAVATRTLLTSSPSVVVKRHGLHRLGARRDSPHHHERRWLPGPGAEKPSRSRQLTDQASGVSGSMTIAGAAPTMSSWTSPRVTATTSSRSRRSLSAGRSRTRRRRGGAMPGVEPAQSPCLARADAHANCGSPRARHQYPRAPVHQPRPVVRL